MKYTCIKTVAIYLLTAFPLLLNASTQKVDIARSIMVGNGIAKFCLLYTSPSPRD